MSALQTWLPGARVLDLFAGSGALGLEALSRGAEAVTFVERSGPALRALTANVRKLGAEAAATIVRGDALAFLDGLEGRPFDLVLADPPYGEGLADALVRRFLRAPFADQLWVEHRATDALPEAHGARTRRYGDTALTAIVAQDATE